MPTERLSMRKTREVLRLKFACGLSKRRIAAAAGIGVTTAGDYVARARRAGLSWPLPADLSDEALERRLFPPPAGRCDTRPEPDWVAIHRELRRPDVTLALLWEEYRGRTPEGFGYSWFCEHYRRWSGRLAPTMRQTHVAGEKLFSDYAGRTVEVIDGASGEIRRAQVFVAALGASSYTYAEASWTQGLADWVGAHVRCFAHLGGVPRQLVSDNLKAAVTRPCRYEPGLNPTFQELAEHYAIAILPARVRKPRDKAKVEVAVQVVQRWILARLRNQRFFSLAELNAAIATLVTELNNRVMRHLGASRRELYEQVDKPALQPLPAEPYQYAEWRRCRVGLDYHVEIDGHFYSVPFRLLRAELEARSTAATVELFHRGKRVAAHGRAWGRGQHSTLPEHMPSTHRAYADWTHERMRRQAHATGPATAALVEAIMRSRKHPEQGFRSCVGILRLAKSYGAERLEAAAERALAIGALSYTSLASILKSGLDRKPRKAGEAAADQPVINHANIRGPGYYH
jgi:transposase